MFSAVFPLCSLWISAQSWPNAALNDILCPMITTQHDRLSGLSTCINHFIATWPYVDGVRTLNLILTAHDPPELEDADENEAIAKSSGVPVSIKDGKPPIQPEDPQFEPEVQRLMDLIARERSLYCASECRRRFREVMERNEPPGGWKIDRAVVITLGNLDWNMHLLTRRLSLFGQYVSWYSFLTSWISMSQGVRRASCVRGLMTR